MRIQSLLKPILTISALAFATGGAAAQDKALLDRIEKEKAERRDCKVAICGAALKQKADGGDIACTVTKTWTTEEIEAKTLKGKISWPWGHAQCKVSLKLDRKQVAKFMAGDAEGKFEKQAVECTLDAKTGAEKHNITFALAPTIKFTGGKAVKASLNWSDIQGSAIAKAGVWSTATLDNNLGVLETAVIESVNSFFGAQCDEVKDAIK